jgi:hypothetical protein
MAQVRRRDPTDKYNWMKLAKYSIAMVGLALLVGCEGQIPLLINSDADLRQPAAAFAADAAKRHYESDAPSGGTAGRAQYGLMLQQLDLANLSRQDWTDVEVWINKAYVVHVPTIVHQGSRTLPFRMFYNSAGQSFDTNGGDRPLTLVQIFRDGKMYDVTTNLAE